MTIRYRKSPSGEHHLVDKQGKVKGIFDSEDEARQRAVELNKPATKEHAQNYWGDGKGDR